MVELGGLRKGEATDSEELLALDVQAFAARCQDADSRDFAEQFVDECCARSENVFAIVDEQQQLSFRNVEVESAVGRSRGLALHTQRARGGVDDRRAVRDGREVEKHRTVAKAR